MRLRCSRKMHETEHIQIKGMTPVGIGQILESGKFTGAPDVVDQNVELSKHVDHASYDQSNFLLIGRVGGNSQDFRTGQLRRGFLQGLCPPGRYRNLGPSLRERLHDGAPYPLAPARDQCNATLKVDLHKGTPSVLARRANQPELLNQRCTAIEDKHVAVPK